MAAVEKRLLENDIWRSQTDDFIKAMTQWRQSIETSNKLQKEMIDKAEQIVNAISGLVWLGNGVKWLAGVVVAALAAMAAWKGYFQ